MAAPPPQPAPAPDPDASLCVCVQLTLIILFYGFFSHGGIRVPFEATKSIEQLQHTAGSGPFTWNVVIDAGSTGSRIHIFKFKGAGKDLQLLSDEFHAIKPGLSSYADDPAAAASSLKNLLQQALDAVPHEQQVGARGCHEPA